jgi:TolA-binding protein
MTDSVDDLSARARRQPLSSADSRALEAALDASAEARLWHRMGTEFDAEDTVLPGDHAATERVLGRLLTELPRNGPRRRRRFSVLLVAAALLVASAAAATMAGLHQRNERTKLKGISGAVAQTTTSDQRESNTPLAALPATSAEAERLSAGPGASPSSTLALAAPLNDANASPAAVGSTLSRATPDSAAELLSAAGRARRDGYANQAITLLDTLQARFPNSPEAHASDVTLGMLELRNGSAGVSGARQHFERYLQRSAQGPLAADALWGLSRAQAAQGNAAQARATLRTLLGRFPSSVYASAARAKLR